MTGSKTPFSSKSVEIKNSYTSRSAINWKGKGVLVLLGSKANLSSKSDTLNFTGIQATPTSSKLTDYRLGLVLYGGQTSPLSTSLNLGAGNDRIINKSQGGTPLGTYGSQIFLAYSFTTLDLGTGNDLIDTDIIRIRESSLFGGDGNDTIKSSQYIQVERWDSTRNYPSVLDLGSGDDKIETTVLEVAGRVLMGEGRDVITGLINDHWSSGYVQPFKSPNYIDLGGGDDIINLKYGNLGLADDVGYGMYSGPNSSEYIEINGGEGFDRILVSGGSFENIDRNGTEVMKYTADGMNFFYRLENIEEVAYA